MNNALLLQMILDRMFKCRVFANYPIIKLALA